MAEHGLPSPWIEKKTCPQCQQENEPGRDFCWACLEKFPEEGRSTDLEGGIPELEEAPDTTGLRLEESGSSVNDQPQDAPSPGGPQPEQVIPPVHGPREESPLTKSPLLQSDSEKKGHRIYPQVTDLQSAEAAAKQGVWAAGIVAVVTTFIALISLTSGTSVLGLDGFAILDGVLFGLIAWGIHRKSRAASIAGLLLYLLELLSAVTDGEGFRGGITIIFFVMAFTNSIRGTFAYNKFHAQLRSVIDPETGLPASKIPELPSLPMPVKVIAGALLTGIMGLALLGLFLPDTAPETAVLTGDQLSTDLHAIIASLDILEPTETILYFYSDGVWDIKEGFHMLTDQALILWGEEFASEGTGIRVPVVRLPLAEITSIGVSYSDSWLEDSAVSVDSGGWHYYFPLSSENGGDRNFITALERVTGVTSTMFELADFD